MKKWYRLLSLIVLISLMSGCQSSHQNDPKKVLIVHSYHNDYSWTKSVDDGIMQILNSENVLVEKVFMDTKRNTSIVYKEKAGKDALAKLKRFNPDVVITSDDNAQAYFGKEVAKMGKVPVVFCGVNKKTSDYDYDGREVTGVLERPHIYKSLSLLSEVAPQVKTFTLLTDKSPTSEGFIDYWKSLSLKIEVMKIIQPESFSELKQNIEELSGDALVVYMYHTIKEKGHPVVPGDIMSWIAQNVDKPSIGFLDFAIEDGVLLGSVESGFEHGELAAKSATEILFSGKQASEITVQVAKKGITLVNGKTAEKLDINIESIKNVVDKVIQ